MIDAVIRNWDVIESDGTFKVRGTVYNDIKDRFKDGTVILTSPVWDADLREFSVIRTSNSKYFLGRKRVVEVKNAYACLASKNPKKVVRQGEHGPEVAVLYSPGFGGGWSTWHSDPKLVFEPKIVKAVIHDLDVTDKDLIDMGYPNVEAYELENLRVQWVPQGAQFIIKGYDGAEYVQIGTSEYITA